MDIDIGECMDLIVWNVWKFEEKYFWLFLFCELAGPILCTLEEKREDLNQSFGKWGRELPRKLQKQSVTENLIELKTMNQQQQGQGLRCEVFFKSESGLGVCVNNVASLEIQEDFKDIGKRMVEVLDQRTEVA